MPVLRAGRLDEGAKEIDVSSVTQFEHAWRIYARSASDDKAPIVALLAALDALRASTLAPTSNIRVIFDGEEEASSPSLIMALEASPPTLDAPHRVQQRPGLSIPPRSAP